MNDKPHSHHVLEISLGWIGIVWGDAGVARLFMPEHDRATVEKRVSRFYPESQAVAEPPAAISQLVDMLTRYANGEQVDFSLVNVDVGDVGPMREAIYRVLREVSYGQTLTYGELAARAGYPGMAREIGEAMGKNPVPIVVPCHRVVAAGGKLGGFSAPGGARTKEKLLTLEGAEIGPPPAAQAAFLF